MIVITVNITRMTMNSRIKMNSIRGVKQRSD